MPAYEVLIIHEYRVIVEAETKEHAEDIVENLMAESSPEIVYIGFEIKPYKIDQKRR